MRMPIDTTAMAFIAAGVPEPVMDFDTRRPKTDENGEQLFSVTVMALADGAAEVISVKTPGEPKGIAAGMSLRLAGLVGLPWSMGDRSGVAYRAAKVEVVRPDARGAETKTPGS